MSAEALSSQESDSNSDAAVEKETVHGTRVLPFRSQPSGVWNVADLKLGRCSPAGHSKEEVLQQCTRYAGAAERSLNNFLGRVGVTQHLDVDTVVSTVITLVMD